MIPKNSYFFFIFLFFLFGCTHKEQNSFKVALDWEYSVSKKDDSIFQSLDKEFKTVPKDFQSPSLQTFPEKKGYIWLKAKFLIPRELEKESTTILLNKFEWERELYLNGNLINNNIEYNNLHWNHRGKNEIFSIPRAYINYDLENTLLVKLYFESEIHFPTFLLIGNENELILSYLSNSLIEIYIPIFISLLFFTLAALHFRLYFLRKFEIEHLYISLSLIFFSMSSIYLFSNLITILGYSLNYKIINNIEFLLYYFGIFFIYKIISNKTKIFISVSEIIIIEIYTIASTILFLLSGYGIEHIIPYSIKNLLPIPILITFISKIFRGTSQKIKFCQYLYPISFLILFGASYDLYTLFLKNLEINYEYFSLSLLLFIISFYKIFETHNKLNKAENKIEYLDSNLKEKINSIFFLQQENDESTQSLKGEYFIASILSEPTIKISEKSENFISNIFIEQKNSFTYNSKTRSIGGDFCITKKLFFPTENKTYLFYCNGDATGKSLKGSIGALSAFIYFETIFSKKIELKPKEFLEDLLNTLNQLFKIFSGNMYLSLSSGLISEGTGELLYSVTGHPKNILYSEGKVDYLPDYQENLIGDYSNPISIFKYKFKVNDILYISSDGRETIELGGIYGGTKSETEKLFLKIIEKSNGDFDFLIHEIKNFGKFSDDFSVIQIKCINIENMENNLFLNDSFETRLKADNYYEMKNFESALEIYLQLSNLKTDPDIQLKIGLCYKNLKLYDNAIDYLLKSYKGNDTNILTFLQLCDTYRLGGYPESATELFLSSEKKFPVISQILKLKSLLKKTDIN
jgi:hypothetical protein